VGLVGFSFGFWIIFSSLIEPVQRLRLKQTLSAGVLGMCIAHLGVGVFAIGAAGVESYKIVKDVALKPGESFTIAGYQFKFLAAREVPGPNFDAVEATVEVTHGGSQVTTLFPQKRHFLVARSDNSKAAISVNWARDLFVAMGNPLGNEAWSMRIQYKPLVRYIWLGAIIMALGGIIAGTDRRYRLKVKAEERSPARPGEPATGSA
jgi:cytochrome c-type biogenesis protein CcmF